MTKFESIALRAVLGQLPPGAQTADFTDWNRVINLLAALTPEQRCDAASAEWLLQLLSPAHQALRQIRNLLIGQRAFLDRPDNLSEE